ncbi:MAG TPA: hypothetical protein VN706_12215 [Gemmatimonadaceae bacterium]|nr:hypothetical protein [Gemmatimonadaceae bacterium]
MTDPYGANMRETERNVGRADQSRAGTRSTAEGETQEPEKVVEDDNVRPERAISASEGSEGSSSTGPDKGRKPNA